VPVSDWSPGVCCLRLLLGPTPLSFSFSFFFSSIIEPQRLKIFWGSSKMENAENRKRKAEAMSLTEESTNLSTPAPDDRKRRAIPHEETFGSSDDVSDIVSDSEESEDEIEGDSDEELEGFEKERDGMFSDYSNEDLGPPECEVEEREVNLGEQDEFKLSFKIYLQEDDEEFEDWMSTIRVRCSHDGEVIGGGYGRYVRRNRIRHKFWCNMEEPSEHLSDVTFRLFDRYGRLNKELKDHEIRKGTGAWGSELDHGDLFIIEEVWVDKLWRSKKIGKTIVTYLLGKSRAGKRSPEFSLVIPGVLNHDIKADIRGKTEFEQYQLESKAQDIATSLYRSVGFRRIGASYVLGLVTDPNHPAHTISPTADFEPLYPEPEDDEIPEDEQAENDPVDNATRNARHQNALQKQLPLHHAASTRPDDECVELFKKGEVSIDEWSKLDRSSRNVLHVAAYECKPNTVRWLLENSNPNQILSSARSLDGYTPQEELESKLEIKRTRVTRGRMTVGVFDNFQGFSPEAIECLVALRGESNVSGLRYSQLKFGCSCGSCIEGCLSPRMRFALLCQAEMTYDILNDHFGDGDSWYLANDFYCRFVAPDIQQKFRTNKSYRQGFANIFDHIASTLRDNRMYFPYRYNSLSAHFLGYEQLVSYPDGHRAMLEPTNCVNTSYLTTLTSRTRRGANNSQHPEYREKYQRMTSQH